LGWGFTGCLLELVADDEAADEVLDDSAGFATGFVDLLDTGWDFNISACFDVDAELTVGLVGTIDGTGGGFGCDFGSFPGVVGLDTLASTFSCLR